MSEPKFQPLPAHVVLLLVGVLTWAVLVAASLAEIGRMEPGFRVTAFANVSINNEPHLPGMRAGLQAGDAVTAVDGRPVRSGPDVLAAVRGVKPGTAVRYAVTRGGKPLAEPIAVPAQRLGPLDFLMSFGVRFAVALAMMLIGAVAAFMKPENLAARANLWLCVGMGVFLAMDIDFEQTYLVPPLLYYGTAMLYAGAALAMALHFPETPPWLVGRWAAQAMPWGVSGLLMLPILGAFAAYGATAQADAIAQLLVLGWPTLALLIGLGIFVTRLRASDNPRVRAQLQVLLLGIAAAYLPMALFGNIPLLVTGQAPPPVVWVVTQALFVVFPLAVAYAILRHGLFDIAIIIKRTSVYAMLTFFLIGGYFATAGTLRWLAGLLGLSQASDWENAIATAVIAVAFVPVRTGITRLVDRLFHRTSYDFRAVVNRVTAKAQSTLDLDEMKQQFMTVIDEALHPRFMYVLTIDAEGRTLSASGPASVWGDAPDVALTIFADDPLLERAARETEMEYVPVTGLTGLLSPLAALGNHYRVPLQVGEDVVGLVVLGPKRSDEDYSAEDRELLAATRLPLATAIKTATLVEDKLYKDRVEQDLRRAREVQEAMLPRGVPTLAGYGFAASSVPCYEASGDYFDFLPLPDGRLGMTVADVAGKGIAAALATAMIKSGLYNQTQTDPEVIPVLTALNRLLHHATRTSSAKSFTTCAYAVLDPAARQLTYACAGHFPPLHYSARAGRFLEYAATGGFPLGVRDHARYLAQPLALGPGDVVVLYSDGVTEAQAPDHLPRGGPIEPGEQFESERLSAVVQANAGGSAQEIHDAVLAALAAFVADGPQTDDVTLVVIKVLAEGTSPADERAPAAEE